MIYILTVVLRRHNKYDACNCVQVHACTGNTQNSLCVTHSSTVCHTQHALNCWLVCTVFRTWLKYKIVQYTNFMWTTFIIEKRALVFPPHQQTVMFQMSLHLWHSELTTQLTQHSHQTVTVLRTLQTQWPPSDREMGRKTVMVDWLS